ALARTSLLSIPSFFAMSYIRTGIKVFSRPAVPQCLHALNMLTLGLPSSQRKFFVTVLGRRSFAGFAGRPISPGHLRLDRFDDRRRLVANGRNLAQITRFGLQQIFQTQKTAV